MKTISQEAARALLEYAELQEEYWKTDVLDVLQRHQNWRAFCAKYSVGNNETIGMWLETKRRAAIAKARGEDQSLPPSTSPSPRSQSSSAH